MSEQLIDTDILLEYLSIEIPNGKWNDFRNCIDNLNYTEDLRVYSHYRYVLMASFSRLGHIEFQFDEDGNGIYSVCPPTLCVLDNEDYGILSGFRTQDLIEEIQNDFEVVKETNYNAPKCIKVCVKDRLKDFQNKFQDIRISENFPQKALNISLSTKEYLENLEKLEDELVITAGSVSFFDTASCRFVKPYKTLAGLYRQDNYGYKKYFLYNNQKWYNVSKDYGKICALYIDKANVFRYSNNIFYVKKNADLPKLVDRALTMKSGKNPKEQNNFIGYENIDLDFARMTVGKMGLKLD